MPGDVVSMSNGRVQTQDVEGTVEAVNPKGLKLGGAWVNVSQFHVVELPEVGAHVRLKVDAKGYIRELEVLDSGDAQSPAVVSGRDARITRLAVLKAAAGFGASRPDMKSSDVLVLAERWLAWVEQSLQG
jgi:hypothetical protein